MALHEEHERSSGDVQAVIEAARLVPPANADPNEENLLVGIIPPGATVEVTDLSQYADVPRRKRGQYTITTLDDFAAFVDEHKDVARLSVWVNLGDRNGAGAGIDAVLNDHGAADGGQGHRDHRVTLKLEPTPEWVHWTGLDGKLGSQSTFAEHIEDGVPEIVEPDGAELLEIAQSFHATVGSSFTQRARLHDGAFTFEWRENVDAVAGDTGSVEVPQHFTLSIAPFVREDPVEIIARLRYRVSRDGGLTIGYKLDRPERVVREAVDRMDARLREKFDGKVFLGAPPA